MNRVRQAGWAAALLCALLAPPVGGTVGLVPAAFAPSAVPTWPVSTLVMSEVVTGGASASDEFVELANQGGATVDLAGLEVVYVTSSGSTVSRRAVWSESRPLDPGQRLLLANGAGVFAGAADATYSGGFAATGGALVLRAIGGAPVDAVGWGDASNAFVEGAAAAAPAAGSSAERRPGGAAGNGQDTNDNAADFVISSTPTPQGLASPPVPAPQPSPSTGPVPTATPAPTPPPTGPVPSPEPTADPSPSAAAPTPTPPVPTPHPTASPVPTPTPTPTLAPPPVPTPVPTPSATPVPSPTPPPRATPAPTPTPTLTPVPTQTPTATVAPTSIPTATPSPTATPLPSAPEPVPTIADARALPDGSTVRIAGVLTTRLGALEDARTAFVQDSTAGIAVHLHAPAVTSLPAGTTVELSGTVDSRFGQRTLRAAESDITVGTVADLPSAVRRQTGAIGEPDEGLRVEVEGTTSGSSSVLSDGIAAWVDDGTGMVRVIVDPAALGRDSIPAGTRLAATGPLGQRDSTGTGTGGYRIHVTEGPDLQLLADPGSPPTPSPTPSVTPTPGPTATSAPTPTPAPTPSPTAPSNPSPTPPPVTVTPIGDARRLPVGSRVEVEGVVTAEVGLAGGPGLVAVQDPSGGILAKLPDGATSPPRGARVRAAGTLHDPFGQLELRSPGGAVRVVGSGALPSPLAIGGAQLRETVEGRLVSVEGVVDGLPRRSSGDVSITLVATDGTAVRVIADGSSGITPSAVTADARYRLTGIVGQRASRKGALDGYRIWLRDLGDIRLISAPVATPAPSASRGPGQTPRPGASSEVSATLVPIAAALRQGEGEVRVRGTVTAGIALLDTSGRRIVIEDESGAIEVLLPTGTPGPGVATVVDVTGALGRAYGAPRVRAEAVEPAGRGEPRAPMAISGPPGTAHEWRLVRVAGTVVDVRRLGSRWRAELETRGGRVPIAGMTGAAIPATSLGEGRPATVVGIVRRAHPTATDRRFSIVPRGPGDVSVGPATAGASREATEGSAATASGGGSRAWEPRDTRVDRVASLPPGAVDADLAELHRRVGQTVRVGGIVVALTADGFTVDDGTALAPVVLDGAAVDYLALIEPEDAINVIGRVEAREATLVVVVSDPAGIVRVGDLPAIGAGGAAVVPGDQPDDEPGGASASVAPVTTDAADGLGLGSSGLVGIGSLLLVSVASLAATIVRRRRLDRVAAARVAARLNALRAPSRGADPVPERRREVSP